jgi:hypothetical protein
MFIPVEAEPEHLDFALQGVTDPEPDAWNVNGSAGDPELKYLERLIFTEEQKAVHELPDLLKGHRRVSVGADDAKGTDVFFFLRRAL